MILLDTNAVVQLMTPNSRADTLVTARIAQGEDVAVSVIVWAEFLCGPVTPEEVQLGARLLGLPVELTTPDAVRGAELFNQSGRRRSSLADCLIAATCLRLNADLVTANLADFRHFEPMGLRVVQV